MPIIQTDKPLRKRDEFDFYPTPIELCRAVVNLLPDNWKRTSLHVLDPGAGSGVWGEAVRERYKYCTISGVEIRDLPHPKPYTFWHPNTDFLEFSKKPFSYDIIIGNPPYKLAEKFIFESFEMLAPGGWLVFLLRLAFLESKQRYDNLFKSNLSKPNHVYVSVRRPSFTGDGKTDATAYAIYLWNKRFIPRHLATNKHEMVTTLHWLDWNYD